MHKTIKVISFPVIIIIMVLILNFNCYAAAVETITKTVEFTTEDTTPHYDKMDEKITQNGNEYKLSSIKYELLDTKNKTEKQDKTTTVTKSNLRSKSYSLDRNADYYHQKVTVDGKEYQGTLTNIEYENKTKTNRYGEVSGNKDYGLRSNKPSPPSAMSLPYYDGDTGQTLTINAPLTSLETTKSAWQDYTYVDIVVSNYTDTQFMFDNKIIKHNGNTVLMSEYYDELLSMAGLSSDKHKIKSVYWTGDAYKNGNMKCRNARADIQAYASAYTARYYQRFALEDVPSYSAKLTYKYSEERVIKSEYTYKAIVTYELIIPEPTQESTIALPATTDEIPKVIKTVTTISVLLAISLGFVIFTMFMLTKIKNKSHSRDKKH